MEAYFLTESFYQMVFSQNVHLSWSKLQSLSIFVRKWPFGLVFEICNYEFVSISIYYRCCICKKKCWIFGTIYWWYTSPCLCSFTTVRSIWTFDFYNTRATLATSHDAVYTSSKKWKCWIYN